MKAISIRQPWAWLIVRPDIVGADARAAAYAAGLIKNIENRTWHTKVRGTVLVHASKGMTAGEYWDVYLWLEELGLPITLPAIEDIQRCGIVGQVDIVDCVSDHPSVWKDPGQFGFVLANAVPLPFQPLKGMLRFFEVPA